MDHDGWQSSSSKAAQIPFVSMFISLLDHFPRCAHELVWNVFFANMVTLSPPQAELLAGTSCHVLQECLLGRCQQHKINFQDLKTFCNFIGIINLARKIDYPSAGNTKVQKQACKLSCSSLHLLCSAMWKSLHTIGSDSEICKGIFFQKVWLHFSNCEVCRKNGWQGIGWGVLPPFQKSSSDWCPKFAP